MPPVVFAFGLLFALLLLFVCSSSSLDIEKRVQRRTSGSSLSSFLSSFSSFFLSSFMSGFAPQNKADCKSREEAGNPMVTGDRL